MHNWKCKDLVCISIPGCENSDGLTGYIYSHEGYFKGGGSIGNTANSIEDCANRCTSFRRLNAVCVAFRYESDNGFCAIYNDNDLQHKGYSTDGTDYVYIKCTGTHSVWYNSLLLFIYVIKEFLYCILVDIICFQFPVLITVIAHMGSIASLDTAIVSFIIQ